MQLLRSKVAGIAEEVWKSNFRERNREGLKENGVITRKKVFFGENHLSMIPFRGI